VPLTPGSWLKQAIHQTNKPKESVIAALKRHLGGPQQGRTRDVVHASDVTRPDFCPRRWAFFDLFAKKTEIEFLSTALDFTFQMGLATETMLVEEWAGDAAIGNWECRKCNAQRTMVCKPNGYCKDGSKHWWAYRQVQFEAGGMSGSPDVLFDVGAPKLVVTEVKTLNPTDFDVLVMPQPEHRLRTNLYLKLVAESNSVYKDKINQAEGRVLYVSRGYGKLNAQWNEILPFKEYIVKREDAPLVTLLQKARAVQLFREEQKMPSGICGTALDPIAKKCSVCQECFSGQHPAQVMWEAL